MACAAARQRQQVAFRCQAVGETGDFRFHHRLARIEPVGDRLIDNILPFRFERGADAIDDCPAGTDHLGCGCKQAGLGCREPVDFRLALDPRAFRMTAQCAQCGAGGVQQQLRDRRVRAPFIRIGHNNVCRQSRPGEVFPQPFESWL